MLLWNDDHRQYYLILDGKRINNEKYLIQSNQLCQMTTEFSVTKPYRTWIIRDRFTFRSIFRFTINSDFWALKMPFLSVDKFFHLRNTSRSWAIIRYHRFILTVNTVTAGKNRESIFWNCEYKHMFTPLSLGIQSTLRETSARSGAVYYELEPVWLSWSFWSSKVRQFRNQTGGILVSFNHNLMLV